LAARSTPAFSAALAAGTPKAARGGVGLGGSLLWLSIENAI
jgi:hypothetical protein